MSISAADIQALMTRTGAPAGPCHRALIAAEGDADRAAEMLVDWPRTPLALPDTNAFKIEMKFGQAAEIPADTLKAGTQIRITLFGKYNTAVPCPDPLPGAKWDGSAPDGVYGLAANHCGDSVVPPGARCWVCHGGGNGSVNVRVRSRGGRWVLRSVDVYKLSNARAKWLPRTKAPRRDEVQYETRKEAEDEAHRLDAEAQAERARRNMRDIERMAGILDSNGNRSTP